VRPTLLRGAVLGTVPVLLGGCALLGPAPMVAPSGPAAPGPIPSASATPAPPVPSTSVTGRCTRYLYPGRMDTLAVTAGSGTATVSWVAVANTTVTAYRVAAESQRLVGGTQPAPAWTGVVPAAGCTTQRTTVTGLAHGTWYVFWLDVVATQPNGSGRDTMIGRSVAVLVP
jgi:hypothetical protein